MMRAALSQAAAATASHPAHGRAPHAASGAPPLAQGPAARLQAAAAVNTVVLQRGRAPLGRQRRRGGRRALALRAGQPPLRFGVILHRPTTTGKEHLGQHAVLQPDKTR